MLSCNKMQMTLVDVMSKVSSFINDGMLQLDSEVWNTTRFGTQYKV